MYLTAFAAGNLPRTPPGSLQRSMRPPAEFKGGGRVGKGEERVGDGRDRSEKKGRRIERTGEGKETFSTCLLALLK